MLVALLLLAQSACSPDHEIAVNLPRWVREVKAAEPARYDELLATLMLPNVGHAGAKSATARLVRSRGPRPDLAVIVVFTVDETLHVHRVQVLRPTRPGTYCVLGSAVSRDVWPASRSQCPAGDNEPDTFTTIDYRFTFLDDPAHAALEVVETSSQFSCRGINGDRTTHAYWSTANDEGLQQLLTLHEGAYSIARGGGDVREWFELGPTLPRFAVQFARHCEQDTPCSTATTRFTPPRYRPADVDGGL